MYCNKISRASDISVRAGMGSSGRAEKGFLYLVFHKTPITISFYFLILLIRKKCLPCKMCLSIIILYIWFGAQVEARELEMGMGGEIVGYRKEKGGILGGELKQSGGQEYLGKGDTHLKEGHTKPCGNLLSQNLFEKHN